MSKINWSKKPTVVRLLGNESFLKEKEVDLAVATFEEYHLEKYIGGVDDHEILSTLETPNSPFINVKKLIIIEDANKVKSKKVLQSYCNNPFKDRVVILISTNRGRDAKWFKELPVEAQRKCEKIKDWNVSKWIVKEASYRGLKISKSYAEAIVVNAGTDLYTLSNELDKLEIYCGSRKQVSAEDIQTVLYDHSSLSPFEIIRYWGEGEKDVALQFFIRHYEKTPKTQWIRSNLVLVNGFLNRVENLMIATSMKALGKSDSNIASALDQSLWIYKNRIMDQVKTRNGKQLSQAYDNLCEIEAQMKSGKPGNLLLQKFIIQY